MQFNQRILDTPSMSELLPSYPSILPDATAVQLSAALDDSVTTEYHYSGTCAMMPLDLGSVVNTDLMVYETSNVKLVDTGIFPLIPTTHLSVVIYAVAEKVYRYFMRGRGLNLADMIMEGLGHYSGGAVMGGLTVERRCLSMAGIYVIWE
jgi:choline dehydrogenase-like flavoprotein